MYQYCYQRVILSKGRETTLSELDLYSENLIKNQKETLWPLHSGPLIVVK